MKEQLVTFNTAGLAKVKGFPQNLPEMAYFSTKIRLKTFWSDINRPYLKCPSQTLLKTWLREEHKIDVDVSRNTEVGKEMFFYVKVSDFRKPTHFETPICTLWAFPHTHYGQVDSGQKYDYEQALEKGLQEALKLIEV